MEDMILLLRLTLVMNDGTKVEDGHLIRLKRLKKYLGSSQLSRITDHIRDWLSTERDFYAAEHIGSDELSDCLETLWEDAIHLFLNLQTPEDAIRWMPLWWRPWTILRRGSSKSLERQFYLDGLLISPRKEGETYQDFEQDFRAHLAQYDIEKKFLESQAGAKKKTDFMKDIETTPGEMSRWCLMHAFSKAAPFPSNTEAQRTVQMYSRRISRMSWSARHHPSKTLLHEVLKVCEELEIMKNIIKSQQKAHPSIVDAIDQPLHGGEGVQHNDHQLPKHKRRLDDSLRISTCQSAWLKTSKLLEEVEQVQAEGQRLGEQTAHLVDIKVEEQAKAVMVFTIVTVIFLPLSFVSSYFGMNTPDIRDMQQGQWIFWAIGLSVTFSTVVVALLVAFRGQRWKRHWNEKFERDHEKGLKVQ
ncbi:MAG: hypothetical protein Q9168_006980 [Polycauliona sp. 1 TL-2023]